MAPTKLAMPLLLLAILLLITLHGNPAFAANTAETCGEFFPEIVAIRYEGPDSTNPLSFRYYNASEVILGRPMSEWLRFSLSFWHTMRGDGSDPFGSPTKRWRWEDPGLDPLAVARRRLDVFFELLSKLGVKFWCFHDRDIAPEMPTLEESNAALDTVAAYAKRLQKEHGVGLLWGTAQLFKHRRYMHGAATSPNATVFAYAAAQVKKAMEVTHDLGGQGYVFWGGREGYRQVYPLLNTFLSKFYFPFFFVSQLAPAPPRPCNSSCFSLKHPSCGDESLLIGLTLLCPPCSTLLNTDMKLETANEARFLRMAAKHAKRIGFHGALMLEPKPQEPTKHQYSWDAATTRAFLLNNNLKEFSLNLECNHATLAGHSCFHELVYASDHGMLSSVDANTGDPQVCAQTSNG